MPEKWISVLSAVRDDNNYLWYKVKVNGCEGWLPQNGIRLKMGGKSKLATDLAKKYTKARRKIMNNPGKWTHHTDDGEIVYEVDSKAGGALFSIVEGESKVKDIFFTTSDHSICRDFFGVDLIGLLQPEVRSKLGTPTMRETPYESPELTTLSFELVDRNMTLSIFERREPGERESTVYRVELHISPSFEIPTPPSKGQWAFPLESTL